MLLLILPLGLSGCGVVARSITDHRQLNDVELEWARVAWRYFEANTNKKTGLVNSIDRYPVATMWHVGDYLAAVIAAREFKLIENKEFDERISGLLEFLNTMSLFFGKLPNRLYNTSNGVMVDYANQPSEIGWSAVDLGRALIWLKILSVRYPEYSEYVDRVVLRWDFCQVVGPCGELNGGTKADDKIQVFREGRLGYEEYAASGFELWGFDAREAQKLGPMSIGRVYDVDIPVDKRGYRETGTHAPLLTGPYVLYGLELDWSEDITGTKFVADEPAPMRHIAQLVYQLQEARYLRERILTARTDHQLGKPPYFVYDSIFAAGYPWNTVSDDGSAHEDLALVSTRAAIAMWALWPGEYTNRLMLSIRELYDPEKGWYEGRYELTGGHEKTITASTNAMVLEALLYKARGGPLHKPALEPSFGQLLLQQTFSRPGKCFPQERPICK